MHQRRLRLDPLFFDYFAGGGGVSEAARRALGRSPDVAINHCEHAIRMHAINHPDCVHLRTDVYDVDPVRDLPPGDVDGFWLSPDCTHHSRARGKKPLSNKRRGLAWIGLRVAAKRRPRVVFLENVPEFRSWGPLGRRSRPIKARAGETFERFLGQLRGLGYAVEHRILDAADYGSATHRRRLVLVARRDGQPIAWPAPTHGPGRAQPFRAAASCIDFSLPCPSIFDRRKPLAEATQRRIAHGIRKFVLEAENPFVVDTMAPTLVQTGYGERRGQRPRFLDIQEPLGTVVSCGAKHALVAAFLAKHNGKTIGQPVSTPIHTLVAANNKSLVACHLTKFYGTGGGAGLDAPAPTVTTRDRLGLVAAFLARHLGGPVDATVVVGGERYAIVDIGLRMITPREYARCHDFDDSYQLTGTQTEQVARVGNSVPVELARAVIEANLCAAKRRAA